MKINTTLEYYDANAEAFVDRTKAADLSKLYNEFLPYIPEGGRILDLGCGSGRDSLHFLELGYEVVAIDGSEAMCLEAEKVIGQAVQHVDIMEIDMEEKFHGIWACASLLHLTKEELKKALPRLMEMLLSDGIMYGSWKYGEEVRVEDGRYFQDFTEDGLRAILGEVDGCTVKKYWISEDVRMDMSSVKWSNILISK